MRPWSRLLALAGLAAPFGAPARAPAQDTIHVEVGSKLVNGRVYAPHAALVRVRVGDSSVVTATWTNELTLGDSAGRPVMRWVTKGTQAPGTAAQTTWELRQTYDAETLAPWTYSMVSSSGAFTQLTITGSHVRGTRRLPGDTADQRVDVTLDRPAGGSVWRRAWVDGVDHLEMRPGESYRLIQDSGTGLIIQGTREWTDYRVSAAVTPHMVVSCGLAARVQGMRRYYALLLQGEELLAAKLAVEERTAEARALVSEIVCAGKAVRNSNGATDHSAIVEIRSAEVRARGLLDRLGLDQQSIGSAVDRLLEEAEKEAYDILLVAGGDGTINLKSEEMDLKLDPEPKDRSIASLNSPLYIKGTFGAPKVAPDWGKVGKKGVAAVVMGALSPLLAVLPLLGEHAVVVHTPPSDDESRDLSGADIDHAPFAGSHTSTECRWTHPVSAAAKPTVRCSELEASSNKPAAVARSIRLWAWPTRRSAAGTTRAPSSGGSGGLAGDIRMSSRRISSGYASNAVSQNRPNATTGARRWAGSSGPSAASNSEPIRVTDSRPQSWTLAPSQSTVSSVHSMRQGTWWTTFSSMAGAGSARSCDLGLVGTSSRYHGYTIQVPVITVPHAATAIATTPMRSLRIRSRTPAAVTRPGRRL